jgi:hypothetical protein
MKHPRVSSRPPTISPLCHRNGRLSSLPPRILERSPIEAQDFGGLVHRKGERFGLIRHERLPSY